MENLLFKVGDDVEYHSVTQDTWVPAKVLGIHSKGTYRLDVRHEAKPARVRARGQASYPGSPVQLSEDFFTPMGMSEIPEAETSDASPAYSQGAVTDFSTSPSPVPGGPSRGACELQSPARAATAIKALARVGVKGSGNAAAPVRRRLSAEVEETSPPPLTLQPSTASGSWSSPPDEEATQLDGNQIVDHGPAHPEDPVLENNQIGDEGVAAPAKGLKGGTRTAVQLLRVHRRQQRWWYEVCPEGAALLQEQGSRGLAVASICGLRGSGKSHFLNLLLGAGVTQGRPVAFRELGDSLADRGTEGLWVWSGDPSGLFSAASSPITDARCGTEAPLLALLDCEGVGGHDPGADPQRDAQLMSLCMMLSTVLILCTHGPPENSLLDVLATSCKFAQHLEERAVERSNEPSRRPDLLWVLRDTSVGNDAGAADHRLEPALDAVLGACPLLAPVANGEGLLGFFRRQKRALVGLDEQADADSIRELLLATVGLGTKSVPPPRRLVVAGLVEEPPPEPLGCTAFVALLDRLVAALNADGMASVRAAWESVQHVACRTLAEELRSMASASLRALSHEAISFSAECLPMTDKSLSALADKHLKNLRFQWHRRAVGDEAIREQHWQDLEAAFLQEAQLLREENERFGDQRVEEVVGRLRTWLNKESSEAEWEKDGSISHEGSQLTLEIGQLVDNVPSVSLARAVSTIVDTGLRRVSTLRAAVVEAHTREREKLELASSRARERDILELELQGARDSLGQALRSEQEARAGLRVALEAAKAVEVLQEPSREEQTDGAEDPIESDRHALQTELKLLQEERDAIEQALTKEREAAVSERERAKSLEEELARQQQMVQRAKHVQALAAEVAEDALSIGSPSAGSPSASRRSVSRVAVEEAILAAEDALSVGSPGGSRRSSPSRPRRLAVETTQPALKLEAARRYPLQTILPVLETDAHAKLEAAQAAVQAAEAREEALRCELIEREKAVHDNKEHAARLTRSEAEAEAVAAQAQCLDLELAAAKEELERKTAGHESMRNELVSLQCDLEAERKNAADRLAALEKDRNDTGVEAKLKAWREERVRDLQQMQELLKAAEVELGNKDTELSKLKVAEGEARQALLDKSWSRREKDLAVVAELTQARSAVAQAEGENQQLERKLRLARWDAEVVSTEMKRLEIELEQVQTRHEACVHERDLLREERERIKAEQGRMLQDVQSRLLADRNSQASRLEHQTSRLIEREHTAGLLEGQIETLNSEACYLREQVQDLQHRVVQAENQKERQLHEKELLREELKNVMDQAMKEPQQLYHSASGRSGDLSPKGTVASANHDERMSKLSKRSDRSVRSVEKTRDSRAYQAALSQHEDPKCGCALQ